MSLPGIELDPVRARAIADTPWPRPLYAWYVVVVLMLAYTNSFVDRQILSLLIEPIRRDLAISDTQVSLLAGIAFSLFYAAMGVPIARLADQANRRLIMVIGISTWSLMTALCGTARSFGLLFLARMGVGVGEAALSPAAFSLLADYFPRHRLARAISIYSMGLYFGAGLALMIGGFVVRLVSSASRRELPLLGVIYPWQLTLFYVALLGLPIILLMRTIREPVRRGVTVRAGERAGHQSSPQALRDFLRSNGVAVGCVLFGFSLYGIAVAAYLIWTPSFLMRTFGWQASQAGWVFGAILLTAGTAGVYVGGYLADRLMRSGQRHGIVKAGLYGSLLSLPFVLLTPLMPNAPMAVIGLCAVAFCLAIPTGLPSAALQVIAPNPLRAQMSSLYLLVVSLIGNGLGPTLVALVTDYGFGDPRALRYSLAIVSALALLLAVGVLRVGLTPYLKSVERTRDPP